MVFFNVMWPPLPSGPNKERKGYIENNGNDESDQNGQKNGEKYKEGRMNKIKLNNFENNFMKPPFSLVPRQL